MKISGVVPGKNILMKSLIRLTAYVVTSGSSNGSKMANMECPPPIPVEDSFFNCSDAKISVVLIAVFKLNPFWTRN